MPLKNIGILIALCATLTIAIDREVRFPPEHEYYHGSNKVNYRARIGPASQEEIPVKGHHGPYNPHYPYSSEESGEWEPHDFTKPYFPESLESGKLVFHGYPKPHFSHNIEELGQLYGAPNPHGFHESGKLNYHGLHKPHLLPNSEGLGDHHALHKPHFPHNSQESGEHQESIIGGVPKQLRSQEQNWAREIHRPDWYNPHFLQQPVQLNDNFEEMQRRRPLFYPIYPYHPFYPHAHPSTNDEEFETIEALKGKNYHGSLNHRNFVLADGSVPEVSEQQKYEGPFYHGSHNPNFPMNSDSFENMAEIPFGPFYHGVPHPHFNPFHKEPVVPAGNDILPPIIFEDPYINSDDFPTSHEAQPYGSPENNDDSQGPFIIIANEENFKLPNIIFDILDHFHHGHGKPHNHGNNKPNEDEDEVDDEGSGEEDIIPLFAETNVHLIQDDVIAENPGNENFE